MSHEPEQQSDTSESAVPPPQPAPPSRPPRLAAAVLDWLLPNTTAAESIRGDAWEEYVQRCETRSAVSAGLWYWLHVMRLSLGVGDKDVVHRSS